MSGNLLHPTDPHFALPAGLLLRLFSLGFWQYAMNTGREFLQKKEKSQPTLDPVTKSSTLNSWRVFEYKSQKQMGIKVSVSRDLSYSDLNLPIDVICRYDRLN